MRKLLILTSLLSLSVILYGQAGRVGINTTTPAAMLHVLDSSVVFTGGFSLPASPGNPPVIGSGIRMMWYSDKAAFRVGRVDATQWDKDNIGNFSFASGNNARAIGQASTAMGQNSEAAGTNSSALGSNAKALGGGSFAVGSFTTASGVVATAMGDRTEASGVVSTAMGNNSVARAFGSLVIGQYNDSIISSSRSVWIDTDPVFIIGNGTAINARSNALTVLKNGMMGINMAGPVAGLDIKALNFTDNRHIRLEIDGSGAESANIFYNSDLILKNTKPSGSFIFRNAGNVETFAINNLGAVKINGGSPSIGRVLTSNDANGNATWQDVANPKVGFTAYLTANQSIPSVGFATVGFDNLPFNDGASFNLATGEFTVTSAGLYHFELSVYWSAMTAREILYLVKNGVRIKFTSSDVASSNLHSQKLNVSIKLLPTDIISVQVFHNSGVARIVNTSDESTYFSGYKVY